MVLGGVVWSGVVCAEAANESADALTANAKRERKKAFDIINFSG
jgi:hypothetical protein